MNKIKLITASIILAITTGCTTIIYEAPDGHKIKVTRFLTNVNLLIDFEAKKAAYSSEPNSEAIKAVAEGITKGLIKSIKP